MASPSDNPASQRHPVANALLVVLSLLLLLTGILVLDQLASRRPLPDTGLVIDPFLLAAAGAILMTSGAVVALHYAYAHHCRAWSVAVVLFQVGIAATLLIVVQGIATLVWTPARGEWAGLANFGILLLLVALPTLWRRLRSSPSAA